MGELRVLDAAGAGSLAIEWPDVYFTPEYGRAAEISQRGDWRVALWEPGPIVLPFLLRPTPYAEQVPGYSDVVSPYGYAGAWGPEQLPGEEWSRFRSDLRARYAEDGVVSEFLRLSALVPGAQRLLAADHLIVPRHHNDTVLIDLRGGFEQVWANAHASRRNHTRRAQRLGYQCRVERCGSDIASSSSPFRVLYDETMRRRGASDEYFFSDDYFAALVNGLDDSLWLGTVEDTDGLAVAAALFMHSGRRMHQHLSGSNTSGSRSGANVWLRFEAMRTAIDLGCESFHLGGGRTPGDSLFTFKRDFGGTILPFLVTSSVILPDVYRALVTQSDRATSEPSPIEFFPAYRS